LIGVIYLCEVRTIRSW